MTCNIKRYPKQKYCLADFRHLITISNIKRNAQFGNDIAKDTISSINVYAVIKDYEGSNYTSITGDSIESQTTHFMIIKYFQELQDILNNSRGYIIEYQGKKFKINDAKNENIDRLYITMKVAMQ